MTSSQTTYSVMYRGPLGGCNYGCGYCPFAKRVDTKIQLQRDRGSLEKFTAWISSQSDRDWKVLFTPWGEALVRSWYRRAVADLTQLPQVKSVAVQTNLSMSLTWLAECRCERLSLWATYHPTETSEAKFVAKINTLCELGVRCSVGVVGVSEKISEIESLRRALPREVYLWINAQQPRPRPYTSDETARFTEIDPMFLLTLERRPSLGKACRAGETTFTVDGRGDMRRCHFVDEVIGNIHTSDWEQALQPRLCPNRFCHCFLGKAQLQAESLAPFFGETLLERIPAGAF